MLRFGLSYCVVFDLLSIAPVRRNAQSWLPSQVREGEVTNRCSGWIRTICCRCRVEPIRAVASSQQGHEDLHNFFCVQSRHALRGKQSYSRAESLKRKVQEEETQLLIYSVAAPVKRGVAVGTPWTKPRPDCQIRQVFSIRRGKASASQARAPWRPQNSNGDCRPGPFVNVTLATQFAAGRHQPH